VQDKLMTAAKEVYAIMKGSVGANEGAIYVCGDAKGRAVQVAPIKPTLKAPGTKRLKLDYDAPLSSVAFKFNLRRYTKGWPKTCIVHCTAY
jgi:hypothetical protein